MRVPKNNIMNKGSYQFFAGLDAAGNPLWVSDINQKSRVLTHSSGTGMPAVIYYPAVGRYILMMEYGSFAKGNLAVYDAPNPWGPWTTVAEYTNWCGFSTTFFWNISPKWINSNDFTLVFTGTGSYDAWNTVTGTIVTY